MSRRSDVCLVLEGTYPYISGGVSSWVHQLICALTDIRFSLLILLPNREYIRDMKYKTAGERSGYQTDIYPRP